jgi:hypothetical protein
VRDTVEGSSDLDELADTIYALNQSFKFAKDMQNEIDRLKDLSVKILCVLWVKLSDGSPVRTEYATVTPDVMMIASIPKRSTHPEEYAALMKYLGIDMKLWSHGEEVVRPHWPGLVEYLSQQISKGLPVPDGIDPTKLYPKYKVRVTKRKPVEDAYTGNE